MGQIINTKDYINKNIDNYLGKVNGQYSKFLEGNPTFVTYFNISNIESTLDEGFGTLESTTGTSSPLRFKQIDDFVLYGIEKLQYQLTHGEYGFDTEIEGEATILPNTIVPNVNDLFYISYIDKLYVFKVTSFFKDHIKSSNYYKIEFKLKSIKDKEDFNGYINIVGEYVTIYENKNTQDIVVIEKSNYDIDVVLNKMYDVIKNIYIEKYFIPKFNSFLFEDNSGFIYDIYLTNFMKKNKLFSSRFDLNSLVLDIEIEKYKNFYSNYLKSYYNNIEVKNTNIINFYYNKSLINKDYTIFDISLKDFYILEYYNLDFNNSFNTLIETTLVHNIQNNIKYEYDCIENIIIKYMNNEMISVDDLNFINSYEFIYSFTDYINIPILLYIIKDIVLQ